ncbi:MAG: phospho-N-acetylmuramoyl-pentapeptide-transferase [Candidatus Omnitrophica bacterium]|nr:phospho-N-acetylmuramoyl-pentapeptide-transferase [Candidatus Omnitrophota bacterium]
MLYHLLYPLREIWFGFNVFKYITFRAAAGAVTAFLISIILGPYVIKWLYSLKITQQVREGKEVAKLSDFHRSKKDTATMGGLLILLAIVLSTLLWADIFNKYIILVLFSTLWLGIVGMIDDAIKVIKKRSSGLKPFVKLQCQILLGLLIGAFLYLDPQFSTTLELPFLKKLAIDLGVFYIFFSCLVIIGSSNAVNLTDGLDGLAIGTMIMIAFTYTAMSYVAGHIKFSSYLNIFYIPGSGELAVFCAILIGACLGFLWFNSYPANVFMGDTGSLALGGAIGTVAVFIKKELLLFLVGGVYVMEAISVILQVISFKTRGKRIFLMTPLHHHFQLKGWPDNKITVRFWIIGLICALLSLATLKLR